ncbi:MAG TPA: GNAT family N-acetyltransferase [Terriglobales bacterium]|nr:GNAT family N-acetyltransferase [Terriglobales bacterium]
MIHAAPASLREFAAAFAPALAPEPCRLHGEWVAAAHLRDYVPAWRESHLRWCGGDLQANPEWCLALNEVYPGAVRLIVLRDGGSIVAAIPMLLRRTEMDCQLGELRVLRFRPRVLLPAGATLALPPGEAAFRAFCRALDQYRGEFDVLRISDSVASPLWPALASAAFARLGLRRYEPEPPTPHHLIRMPKTMTEYLSKFTSKTRKNRLREVKHLEEQGTVELRCVSRLEEIDSFLELANGISRSSYQHRLLGVGLRAPAQLRRRLEVAAIQGWLRSYLLLVNHVACSFMLGYQYEGCYCYTKVGYAPEFAKFSVGSVLQLMVLQDLFNRDTPELFDLGTHGPQKQYFGNDQYDARSAFFFSPGLYPWAVRNAQRGSRWLSASAGAALESWNLKPKVQRLIRQITAS